MQRMDSIPILCICIKNVYGNTILQFDANANANVDASVNEALFCTGDAC